MSLEKTFAYFTHHSETITQWLCLATLVLVAAVVARALFSKRGDGASAGETVLAGASPELQGTLTKIIDQISRLEGLNLKNMTSSEVAGVDLEVQALKADLHARELELAALRAAAPAGGAPNDTNNSGLAADTAGLSQRVRELEAKLAEYEILEDDIADLSLYKDENVRLRSELDRLKAAPPVPPASPASEPVAAAVVAAEPAPIVRSTPAEVSEAAASAAEAAGALMADFESFIETEPETHQGISDDAAEAAGGAPEVPPAAVEAPLAAMEAPPAAVEAPLAAMDAPPAAMDAPPPTEVDGEADDLFAEFASVAASAEGLDFASENLDTEKVLAEMAALSAVPDGGTDNALEQTIDIEKMALEAKSPGRV